MDDGRWGVCGETSDFVAGRRETPAILPFRSLSVISVHSVVRWLLHDDYEDEGRRTTTMGRLR